MKNLNLKKLVNPLKLVKKITAVVFFLTSSSVFASSSTSLPFGSTLQTLAEAIKGPWLLSASIIMVVATCFMLAFGEHSDGFRKIINIVMWLSIAFGITSFITTMFGGGAVF